MDRFSAHPLSEGLRAGGLLAFFGGFIDTYIYSRSGVFAFGQTGNIIFLGHALALGRWTEVIHYLSPILLFIAGVYCAEEIRFRLSISSYKIHWQQILLWIEAIILTGAAFLPKEHNMLLISAAVFASALQTQAFRAIKGQAAATTMCTGNLRAATELFSFSLRTGDGSKKEKSLSIYGVVLLFALGAFCGSLFLRFFGSYSIILGSAGLIGVSFLFSQKS